MKYTTQQKAFATSDATLADADRKTKVLCPKPRRICPLPAPENFFLLKGGETLSVSPPFFCCSPPVRATNPVVHDARFGEEQPVGLLWTPLPGLAISNGSPRGNDRCVSVKLGFKPAAVRIEGFDSLGRGSCRGCRIIVAASQCLPYIN